MDRRSFLKTLCALTAAVVPARALAAAVVPVRALPEESVGMIRSATFCTEVDEIDVTSIYDSTLCRALSGRVCAEVEMYLGHDIPSVGSLLGREWFGKAGGELFTKELLLEWPHDLFFLVEDKRIKTVVQQLVIVELSLREQRN